MALKARGRDGPLNRISKSLPKTYEAPPMLMPSPLRPVIGIVPPPIDLVDCSVIPAQMILLGRQGVVIDHIVTWEENDLIQTY